MVCEKCAGTGYVSAGGGLEFALCDCEPRKKKGSQCPRPTAVLSTVVLPVDGTYRVETLDLRSGMSALDAHCQDGPILHFIGHPATRKVVEACGAVYAGQGTLFPGLEVGQWCLCFPIAQGRSDRSQGGSAIHQEVGEADLSCRRVTRLA